MVGFLELTDRSNLKEDLGFLYAFVSDSRSKYQLTVDNRMGGWRG